MRPTLDRLRRVAGGRYSRMDYLFPGLLSPRVALIAACLASALGATDSLPIEARLAEAKRLMSVGNYAQARSLLTQPGTQPGEAPADFYYQLAVVNAHFAETQGAEQALDQALAKEPDYLPALHLRAYLRFSAGRYREALHWAEQYLQKDPASGKTRKISGLARFMLGDKPGAEADLQRVSELLPRDFDAHYYLGRVYYERTKLSPALEAFQESVEINPRSVKAHNHLGQTLEGLTRFEEARESYRKAIELERQGPEKSEWPYYNLGVLLLAEGHAQDAVALLEEALDRNPASAQTRTKLGVALAAASRDTDAIRALEAVVEADPLYADAHFQLGRLLMKLGRSEEARQHLQQFERLRDP